MRCTCRSLRDSAFRIPGPGPPLRSTVSVPELGYIIPAMAASAPFTLGGFLARFAFALLVAGATYNPTRYSYYAWAKRTGFEWSPPTVFVGVVLLIGWFVCLRLTLRSLGGLGFLLANAFLAALYWEIMTLTRAGPLNAVACSSADFRSFGFSTNQPFPPNASIILS